MGKTILTPKQLDFLELAQAEKQITKQFYLTGGTALAAFYLHHRLSEDIDLFTQSGEVNQKLVEAFLQKVSPALGIKKIRRSQFLGLVSYLLLFSEKSMLKVDFNYYPFPRINKGIQYKNLEVDSLYDIAVNKLHTLFMKPRARDYIDLYFIMTDNNYPLDKLIVDAKTKFDWDIDRISLASQFIRVEEFTDAFPKILKPFSLENMERFYLNLAGKMKKDIFK